MNTYQSPFNSRYSSKKMQQLFSSDNKFKTWRKLWIALAESQKELGLTITDEQINELIKFKDEINYDVANKMEAEFRHDVMAHVHAYGQQCPKAKAIIHLGATSCYVGDNADIIIIKDALTLIKSQIIKLIRKLSKFALDHKDLPTLGLTHLQPAQLVTVGKRACLWIQDLSMDLEDLNYVLENLKLLGSKGTTGTQASFLSLFDGDEEKVKKLESLIAKKMGFTDVYRISGQTYSRKIDYKVLSLLSSIAQSAYKFSNDLRILQSKKEIEEPFEVNQIGSSAMPYKRNPMRAERISALARLVIVNTLNPAITASTQWFERTLDDSANRRISISEGFLALDAVLNIYLNISSGLVVYPKVIQKHVQEELPFMATENILMEAVKKGGDRQELHERIRAHSIEASKKVKIDGEENDLIERICNDNMFSLSIKDLNSVMTASNYIGRSISQVEEFLHGYIINLIGSLDDAAEDAIEYDIII